jgi:hypothetical protein
MSGWNGIFYNGVFCCGFDFLPTGTPTVGGVFSAVNGSPTIGSSYAHVSGYGIQFNGNQVSVGKALGVNLASMYVGIAYECVALPTGATQNMLFTFYDSTAGAPQLTVAVNSSGQLGFYLGTNGLPSYGSLGSLVGSLSPSGTIVGGSYNYLEFFVTINASTGAVTCNVNGTTVITATGVNTKSTANAYTNYIYFGSSTTSGGSCNQYFDDLYMLDTTGASPYNTFLGPGRIQTDGPSQDSATSGLNNWSYTTPPGTDYGCCDNIPANSAQYCYDSTVGDRMSFRFPSLTTAKVFFLNTWYLAEEDAAGTRTIVPIFRNNSVDQVGPSPNSLGTTYTYYNQPSTLDPNTGAAWSTETVATAAGCEIGLKVNS